MLVDFNGLAGLRGRVAMVDGGFDPIHFGHVAYFREAMRLGLPILCNVSPDAYIERKHRVLLPQDARIRIIEEFRSIDYVHASDRSTAEVLEQLRPRYYVKGRDWQARLPARETEICDRYDIGRVFLDTETDFFDTAAECAARGCAARAGDRCLREVRPVAGALAGGNL